MGRVPPVMIVEPRGKRSRGVRHADEWRRHGCAVRPIRIGGMIGMCELSFNKLARV